MSLHPNAQSPRVGGPGRGWMPAWGFGMAILAAFTIYSAASITHGFVAYYAAARLLAGGALGPSAYDDAWFGAFVQQLTASNIREIFTPNPPTMALMALPVAAFDHDLARAMWLFVSVALFGAAVFALARHRQQRDGSMPIVPLLLAMLAPAVFTNIRIGQGYLIVFAAFAAAVLWLSQRRDVRGGTALGLLLALKLSGTGLLICLAAQRRWHAIAVTALVAVALALAVTPFIDAVMWWQYPDIVRAFVQRPSGSVTAYQTTLSLFRRLCVADPAWNPSPAASCQPIAFAIPYTLLAIAMLVTAVTVHRGNDPRQAAIAGTVLSLLALPAAAEVHFVLLGVPLLLLPLRAWELAIVGALLLIPLDVTAERFTSGWVVLLAYPRLYAAWWFWAASVRRSARFSIS
jgi:hypothetical protein